LSYQLIGLRHPGQRERGVTMDSCFGSREIQTFRKLPISNPKKKAASPNIRGVDTGRVYGQKCHFLCEV
jgi:hypothetical protein